jgi:hypothetical protein
MKFEHGIIHPLRDGHIIFLKRDVSTEEFYIADQPMKLRGMLEIRPAHCKASGEVLGYFLYTGYRTRQGGSFLVAHMHTKAGKATTAEVLVRHDQFVVIDLPGCGTMALSGTATSAVTALFQEQ